MPFANNLAALRALASVAFTKLPMTYTTSERDYEHKNFNSEDFLSFSALRERVFLNENNVRSFIAARSLSHKRSKTSFVNDDWANFFNPRRSYELIHPGLRISWKEIWLLALTSCAPAIFFAPSDLRSISTLDFGQLEKPRMV
jgi:hypothetical protein